MIHPLTHPFLSPPASAPPLLADPFAADLNRSVPTAPEDAPYTIACRLHPRLRTHTLISAASFGLSKRLRHIPRDLRDLFASSRTPAERSTSR